MTLEENNNISIGEYGRENLEHQENTGGISEIPRKVGGKENDPKQKCEDMTSTHICAKKFVGVRSRSDTSKHLDVSNHGMLKGSVAAGAILVVLVICIFPQHMPY